MKTYPFSIGTTSYIVTEYILNNSFGMLGINSVVIVKRVGAELGGVYG